MVKLIDARAWANKLNENKPMSFEEDWAKEFSDEKLETLMRDIAHTIDTCNHRFGARSTEMSCPMHTQCKGRVHTMALCPLCGSYDIRGCKE